MTALLVALVVVLLVVSLGSLGALYYLRKHQEDPSRPGDEALYAAIERQRPAGAPIGTRRVITVEILNPIELAGTRNRIVGLAGGFAPGITSRIVYDQTLKTLRRELLAQDVVADVRLHTLRRRSADRGAREPVTERRPARIVPDVAVAEQEIVDDVQPVVFDDDAPASTSDGDPERRPGRGPGRTE